MSANSSQETQSKRITKEEISALCKSTESIEGTVVAKVKGGFTVDIGISAFLPNKLIDFRRSCCRDKLIGRKMDFRILKFNFECTNIVVSRHENLVDETMERLQEGTIVKGIVINLTDHRAFVDLGDVDGSVRKQELSWGFITHPRDVLSVGQSVDFKVLSVVDDEDNDKLLINLSLKKLKANPWVRTDVETKYLIDEKVKGEIIGIVQSGIFLKLNDGLHGFIKNSKISWSHISLNIKTKYSLKIGAIITGRIYRINHQKESIDIDLREPG